jgi:hypothetical protein
MKNEAGPAVQKLSTAKRRVTDQHFAVSETPDQYSFHVGNGMLRMYSHNDGRDVYWDGEFIDGRGIVSILRQADYLRLDFATGGRCYTRHWDKYYGDRTVRRLCRAFITDILSTPSDITGGGE